MFSSVQAVPLPDGALLAPYSEISGGFTDCYVTEIVAPVTLAEFVTAFYTTPLFRLERIILAVAVRSPSTDVGAADIGTGKTDKFAAWTTEARCADQLLMCPIGSRTRSWFMVSPQGAGTRVYFGSAVVPDPKADEPTLGRGFNVLHGAHVFYSKALLASARRRLG